MTTTIEDQDLAEELLTPLLRDAEALARSGFASAADIDTAMRLGAGHPRGPFAVLGRATDPPAPARDTVGASLGPVGVVGSGTMATGIAEAIAKGGGHVVLVARGDEAAERSRAQIAGRAARAVERGRLDAAAADALVGRLTTATSLDALHDVELVIEAVIERLDVKQALLADLGERLPAVPLATNTSSFRVADVSARMRAPERALALHFFNPAAAMKLVEVVGHDATDPRTLELGAAWARSIGKQTVTCGDASGFLVNRLLIPYLNDAARTCSGRGVAAAEADDVVTTHLGHPMGPFALMDLIGLDVMCLALETMQDAFGEARYAPCDALREHVAHGRLGRKSGEGFLAYGAQG